MSSNTVLNRPPRWSLAWQLTTWYAVSAFMLILAVTGFLYWGLSHSFDREDDQMLSDKIVILRVVLNQPGQNPAVLRQEVEESRQTGEVATLFVRILRADGSVETETSGMAEVLPPQVFPKPVREIGTGTDYRSSREVIYRLMAVTEGDTGWTIQVAMDRTQDLEMLAEYRQLIWLTLPVALILCSFVGYQIVTRGLKPLRRMGETAQRVNPEHLSERIATESLPSELFVLAGAFNTMLDRMERSFERLGRFSADIAHELRTPINNLRGEIEVALTKERSAVAYQEVLSSGLEECGRLGRMIESLLLIARSENPRTQTVSETLNLASELSAVAEFYEGAASEAGVQFKVVVDPQVRFVANRPLFQRAIGNLISNSLASMTSGGTITLAGESDSASVTITVTDTGCGIASEDLPRVFERFYRADPSRTTTTGNMGLGLSIVKGIVEMHAGTVSIASQLGKGTTVRIVFPLKEDQQT